ncbi:MAG: dihydroorotase [Gemmatimonadota bacterium]
MSPLNTILVRRGRIIDPITGWDSVGDVRLREGRVLEVAEELASRDGETVFEAEGHLVTPGLVDLHVHFREPGQEAKETIAAGATAAAAGGYTTVCVMPNTTPVVDEPGRVRFVADRGRVAGAARVLPIASATVGSRGERLTDIAALARAGAVAVSDDGLPIATSELLAGALIAAREAGIVVADHCEDLGRSAGGAVWMEVAGELGVGGIPPEAESEAVGRDLDVLAESGGRLHVCHVSTAASVARIREARRSGLAVTAEVSPHHLTLTAEAVERVGSQAKMNPPLASEADRKSVVDALLDGTIDCVATDHAPHAAEEKDRGLAAAPFGVVGLETAFGVLHTDLVLPGHVPLAVLIERLTAGPARVFALPAGTLEPGAPADLAVFDLEAEWEVDPETFRSRGRNSPWVGRRLVGRPVLTVVGGRVVYDRMSSGGDKIRSAGSRMRT